MIEKLHELKKRYDELSERMSDPSLMDDQAKYLEAVRAHSALEDAAAAYGRHNRLTSEIDGLREIIEIEDGELKEMAQSELDDIEAELSALNEDIKLILRPRAPEDDRNVILEIRAGTGGEEASLFGGDLLRMYMRYAERKRFKYEILSSNMTELGGVKEVVMSITGKGPYHALKYESGVHRVQRVPETESQGRIHTSATTVAVLPEAEDVEVNISPNDLRVDVYRSGGHGGQSVNTTDSAVRITHLPTGLVVTCQDEKSQLKNKEKAMRVLKSRLLDLYKSERDEEYAARRKKQVGSGDRSERVRTYNFPQGRVTDHRVGLTLYKLDSFMDGDCDEVFNALLVLDEE